MQLEEVIWFSSAEFSRTEYLTIKFVSLLPFLACAIGFRAVENISNTLNPDLIFYKINTMPITLTNYNLTKVSGQCNPNNWNFHRNWYCRLTKDIQKTGIFFPSAKDHYALSWSTVFWLPTPLAYLFHISNKIATYKLNTLYI